MLQRLRRTRPDQNASATEGEVRLIVGLGNPGRRYQGNRHNVGFMAVERIARDLPPGATRSRFQSEILETRLDDRRIILAKPQTFMNNSGEAVQQLLRWYKARHEHLLVIYDELDLPFGTIRLRAKGSDAGHNGVSSVIQHLGTQEFPRLRVGVGRPTRGSTVPYVLSDFSSTERRELPLILDRSRDAALDWLNLGIDTAMNLHNRKPAEAPT